MVWKCPECHQPVPDDSDELLTANFCRHCGAAYFVDDDGKPRTNPPERLPEPEKS
jgi:DNA-directed RNA polymerase subunit RPC12/RpoP